MSGCQKEIASTYVFMLFNNTYTAREFSSFLFFCFSKEVRTFSVLWLIFWTEIRWWLKFFFLFLSQVTTQSRVFFPFDRSFVADMGTSQLFTITSGRLCTQATVAFSRSTHIWFPCQRRRVKKKTSFQLIQLATMTCVLERHDVNCWKSPVFATYRAG